MTEEKLPLARKYRPTDFDEMYGNQSTLEALQLKVEEGVTTTYLLEGPRGTGKTTLGRIIADKLGATKQSTKELNVSDIRGIDAARSIIHSVKFAPLSGKCKVIVLNECHSATKDWQNAMLEVLEEPPKNTYFILCTTEPEKLLKTVISRCAVFKTAFLRRKETIKLLENVIEKEGADKFPVDVLTEISKASEGSPREALKILDSVIDIEDDDKLMDAIHNITLDEIGINELSNHLLRNWQSNKWKETATILKSIKEDPEKVRRAILSYMNKVLLGGKNPIANAIIIQFSDSYFYIGQAGLTSDCYETIINTEKDVNM